MALTKEFTESVDSGKKIRVRIMLKDIMLVDPSFKSFDEMIDYAEKNMRDLYDQHDGEYLNNDSSLWDEDYMNQHMVHVVTNFSKERVDLLKKIVKKLYGHKVEQKVVSAGRRNTSSSASIGGFTGVQKAGVVVAIVGAGTLVGGIVGSSAPIAIAGGVVLAGGVVMVALGGNKVV